MDRSRVAQLPGRLHELPAPVPENREQLKQFSEGCNFGAEETGLIMAGTHLDRMPAALTEKLKAHDLVESFDS